MFGTYLFIAGITLLLFEGISSGDISQIVVRLYLCFASLVYMAMVFLFLRADRTLVATHLLIVWYVIIGAGTMCCWGANTPISTLFFALAIVFAAILLGARYALATAAIVCLVLLVEQVTGIFRWYVPNDLWTTNSSSLIDVGIYCIVFSLLALVSWLYSREMERTENVLIHQKHMLRIQVKRKTAQLRRAQLEELRQMYRFADLGQLGVTLLHDLANHVTSLTLEIEGVKSKKYEKSLERARETTKYLEKIIDRTRQRLQGDTEVQTFDIVRKTGEVISFLNYKASKVAIDIDWQPPTCSWSYTGDVASYCQVIAIILNNAVDAYGASQEASGVPSKIVIVMSRTDKHILIKVSDWGKGIDRRHRKDLFKPFRTTKRKGMGIGLFIARQTIESSFSGTLMLNLRSKHTEFVITLPRTDIALLH